MDFFFPLKLLEEVIACVLTVTRKAGTYKTVYATDLSTDLFSPICAIKQL